MSRLFEDAGTKGARRWQCFVCGKNFGEFLEYKDHIVEIHEEGREFLKCPVDSCGCPVRDLKTHFKCKHPQRVMPRGIQTRVTVWHDFKPAGKGKNKRTTRKPSVRTGEFESKKNGRLIHYRSGLEEEFYSLLEHDSDVAAFNEEVYKVPYYWNGKWHNYIPDLRVDFVDGTVQIWEVKPANQTDYDQNKAKWSAANDWAQNHGWEFIVQTEVGLGKLKNKVKKQS
jgi:hypothetical protein